MTGPVLLERPFTSEEARRVAAWSYEPPFDFYDMTDDVALVMARDDRGYGYYPVQDGPEVVGYVCFGAEARVRGQEEVPGTCDVGMGLDPARLSGGVATALVPQVVAFAVATFGVTRLRAAVAAFNERSLRLCESAGFRRVREFAGPEDRPFVELVLEMQD